MATAGKTESQPKSTGTRAKAANRSPEEVARAAFEAVAARDIDGILAQWSPEGVNDWVTVGIFRGHGEIRDLFEQLFASAPDFEIVVDRIVADDSTACVQWRSSATSTGAAFMGIEPTGRTVALRGVDVMQIEDGQIVRNTVYYDGLAFARGVGMLPAQDSAAEKAMFAAFNATTRLRKAIRERTSGTSSPSTGRAT